MVSIKDIAHACGVSTATVSKALNNRDDVNPLTRERVQETARQLGYLPNAMARALKTNKTYNIGVLMVDKADSGLKHHYFASILDSFKVVMERSGYDLTFISSQIGAQLCTYYEHCVYRNVDGVLAACVDFSTPEIQALLKSEIPVVSVDYVSDGKYSVISDNEAGIRSALGYALRMGHRNIAYIYGESSQVTEIRKNAFIQVLEEYSIQPNENMILEAKYLHPELSYELTRRLLSGENRPTCILYPDDLCAVAGMRAIQDAELRVGSDVSVVGFDGHPILRMLGPQLTTIQQDTEAIGQSAARLMLRLLQKEEIPMAERVQRINVQLLEGNTVAQI